MQRSEVRGIADEIGDGIAMTEIWPRPGMGAVNENDTSKVGVEDLFHLCHRGSWAHAFGMWTLTCAKSSEAVAVCLASAEAEVDS